MRRRGEGNFPLVSPNIFCLMKTTRRPKFSPYTKIRLHSQTEKRGDISGDAEFDNNSFLSSSWVLRVAIVFLRRMIQAVFTVSVLNKTKNLSFQHLWGIMQAHKDKIPFINRFNWILNDLNSMWSLLYNCLKNNGYNRIFGKCFT